MPAVTLWSVSAPIFIQHLTALANVLDKAAAHFDARKIAQEDMLSMRFYPDMFPFVRQVRQATNHAVNAIAQTAGVAPPALEDSEKNFADLKARIAKAVDFIRSVKPEQVAGQEDKEITLKLPPGDRTFTGQSLVLNFCLPNFYFHTTTAYDLLRHMGVELGKRDFMGTPPQM